MKRGWIFWDKNELPEAEFFQRIEKLKSAMRAEKLAAVVIYGDAHQSGNLAYLTHFFPYADTGAFVMPVDSPPRLFTTHAYRNMPWFNTITWVQDIICTNFIGRECADYLASINKPFHKIGLVSARALPYSIFEAIQKKLGCELLDFSAAYDELRIIKSERELAFIQKAAAIAEDSFKDLAAAIHPEMSGFDIAAGLELSVRRRGAEDLFCFIQPDGSPEGLTWPDSRRIQGYFSVEIAVEYDGYWAKLGRTLSLDGSFQAFRPVIERYTQVCLQFLEDEFSAQAPSPFVEGLRSRLSGIERLRPVRLLVDFGLEPYWGTHVLKSEREAIRLKNQMALYLQACLDFDNQMRLLRTDTFMIRDSRPILLTPS